MTNEDMIVAQAQMQIGAAPKGAVVEVVLLGRSGRTWKLTFQQVDGNEYEVQVYHLAEDGGPEPTEIERALISRLIDRIAGDPVPLRDIPTERMRAMGGGRG